MPSKVCTSCKVLKDNSQYHKNIYGKYGTLNKCAECKNASAKAKRILEKEKGLDLLWLRDNLDYNPTTGEFRWLEGAKGKSVKLLGANKEGSYNQIGIGGVNYKAHRLAYFYMTGEWPEVVDHINGAIHDNRWENLRGVSQKINAKNNKRSASKNVFYDKISDKWIVKIERNGEEIGIGSYRSRDYAIAVAREAVAEFEDFIH